MNPFKWLEHAVNRMAGVYFDPSQQTCRLPAPEPRYTGFKPPKYWRFQCPACGARVQAPYGVCWMCNYGADGSSTAYYDKYGHQPGETISPDCGCRHCQASRPKKQAAQRPVPSTRKRPASTASSLPASPYSRAMDDRIADAFHFSDFGNYHYDIEVQWSRGQWFIHCRSCCAMWSVEACNLPAATDGFYFEVICQGTHSCYG